MNLHDLIGYLVHRTDVKMTNYFTKKLKNEGKPNRLNSSAIFPDIIFVPVIKRNRNNTTFTTLINIKIAITSFLFI